MGGGGLEERPNLYLAIDERLLYMRESGIKGKYFTLFVHFLLEPCILRVDCSVTMLT